MYGNEASENVIADREETQFCHTNSLSYKKTHENLKNSDPLKKYYGSICPYIYPSACMILCTHQKQSSPRTGGPPVESSWSTGRHNRSFVIRHFVKQSATKMPIIGAARINKLFKSRRNLRRLVFPSAALGPSTTTTSVSISTSISMSVCRSRRIELMRAALRNPDPYTYTHRVYRVARIIPLKRIYYNTSTYVQYTRMYYS